MAGAMMGLHDETRDSGSHLIYQESGSFETQPEFPCTFLENVDADVPEAGWLWVRLPFTRADPELAA